MVPVRLVVTTLMVVLSAWPAVGAAADEGNLFPSESPAQPTDAHPSSSCHQQRGAIAILTDSDFTPANGVRRGNGTQADPYVIDCWLVSSNTTFPIEFGWTAAHFVIRDVEVASVHGRCMFMNGTTNGVVERFTAGECGELVSIHSSARIVVRQSDLVGNRSRTKEAVRVWNSGDVSIVMNNISGADRHGVDLCGNLGTVVALNAIEHNRLGLSACSGSGESIHHNRFIDNDPGPTQATDAGSNRWDDGSEGNWWSDLTGPDEEPDGIVDTPYAIGAGAFDRFPLCPLVGCWSSTIPKVSISANRTSGVAPLDVGFTSNVTGGIGPYNFYWDFVDGNGSTEPAPTHSFSVPGTYAVELEVHDSAGHEAFSPQLFVMAEETKPPFVVSTDPPSGAFDLPTETAVTIHFSTAMDIQSTENAIAIAPRHPISYRWSADSTAVVVVPAGELALGMSYSLSISTQARSAGGLALPEETVVNFTTAAFPPESRPVIVHTFPRDGDLQVPTNSFISISFNVKMETAATEAAISSVPPVHATYSWDPDQLTLRIDPAVELEKEKGHRFSIDLTARSADGASPTREQSFAFNTSAGPDLTPPLILHASPPSLTEGRDASLKFQVSDDSAIARVMFYYRASNSSEYSETEMHPRSGDDYVAILPSASIRLPHVEYYVDASDGLGNRGLDPGGGPESPYRIPVVRAAAADLGSGLISVRDAATLFVILVSVVVCLLIWDPRWRPAAVESAPTTEVGAQDSIVKSAREPEKIPARKPPPKRTVSKHRTNPP